MCIIQATIKNRFCGTDHGSNESCSKVSIGQGLYAATTGNPSRHKPAANPPHRKHRTECEAGFGFSHHRELDVLAFFLRFFLQGFRGCSRRVRGSILLSQSGVFQGENRLAAVSIFRQSVCAGLSIEAAGHVFDGHPRAVSFCSGSFLWFSSKTIRQKTIDFISRHSTRFRLRFDQKAYRCIRWRISC